MEFYSQHFQFLYSSIATEMQPTGFPTTFSTCQARALQAEDE